MLQAQYVTVLDEPNVFNADTVERVLLEIFDTKAAKVTSVSNPTINSIHPVGTIWINTVDSRVFICIDNTPSNAEWFDIYTFNSVDIENIVKSMMSFMVSGNTETNIDVTYDFNGKLNFMVPEATYVIKGVASFNDNFFDVVSGYVSIKSKSLTDLELANDIDATPIGFNADKVDGRDVSDVSVSTLTLWTSEKTKNYIDGKITGLDWQESVLDIGLYEPPTLLEIGDRYIVASMATSGAYLDHENEIAEFTDAGWEFTPIDPGTSVWVESEDVLYTWNGVSWVKIGTTITHNNLIGLQGGNIFNEVEYYHLTLEEHQAISGYRENSLVFAGPPSAGFYEQPQFRYLVENDIPEIPDTKTYTTDPSGYFSSEYLPGVLNELYETATSQTLDDVTTNGNITTNDITVNSLTVDGYITNDDILHTGVLLDNTDDLDLITTNDIYYWESSVPSNNPDVTNSQYSQMLVLNDSTEPTQIVFGSNTGWIWTRRRNTGVWGDWIRYYSTGSDPWLDKLTWNSDDGTLDLDLAGGSSILQIGQETLYRVSNKTGSGINDGTAVRFADGIDASGRLMIEPAVADGSNSSSIFMGLTTETIPSDADGFVTRFGKVRDIDTTGTSVGEVWVDGDILYLHPTIPGALTKVKPEAPNNIISVAIVIHAAVSGTLHVLVVRGSRLSEDESVQLDSLTDRDILQYQGSTGRFENRSMFEVGLVIQSGFENRDDSILSFNDGTRTLTITPTSTEYYFWLYDKRFQKTVANSVIITNTEGIHYVYFNENGTLVSTQTFSSDIIIHKAAYVAIIYWDHDDQKAIIVSDERHGRMDSWTHEYIHETVHARWVSGLACANIIADGDGSSDTHAQLSVTDGVIRDEDIRFNIDDDGPQDLGPIAQIPLLYRDGATGVWKIFDATDFPIHTNGSGRAVYNEWDGNTWTLTEVSSGSYVFTHLIAIPEIRTPIMGIIGQNEYNSKAAAEAGAEIEILNLLQGELQTLAPEWVNIATIIFQTSDSFTNSVKSVIVSTQAGGDYVDWRSATPSGISTSVALSSHNDLMGRSVENTHPISAITDLQNQLDTRVISVSGGEYINVDNTDPQNPIVSLDTDVIEFNSVKLQNGTELMDWAVSRSSTDYLDIAEFSLASFRSGKFVIQSRDTVTGEVQITELLIVHDGTTAVATEYGVVYTGSDVISHYNVYVNTTNIVVSASGATSNTTEYKIMAIMMVA